MDSTCTGFSPPYPVCSRGCERPLEPGRDGPCEVCIWCQEDDYRLGRPLPPGAIIRQLHEERNLNGRA